MGAGSLAAPHTATSAARPPRSIPHCAEALLPAARSSSTSCTARTPWLVFPWSVKSPLAPLRISKAARRPTVSLTYIYSRLHFLVLLCELGLALSWVAVEGLEIRTFHVQLAPSPVT